MCRLLCVVCLLVVSSGLAAPKSVAKLSVGLDFGTSGVRRCIINQETLSIENECNILWSEIPQNLPSSCSRAVLAQGMGADESSWTYALLSLLYKIPQSLKPRIDKICISGTSASCLIYDHSKGIVTRKPRMYSYNILAENPAPDEQNRKSWRHRNVQSQDRAHEAAVRHKTLGP